MNQKDRWKRTTEDEQVLYEVLAKIMLNRNRSAEHLNDAEYEEEMKLHSDHLKKKTERFIDCHLNAMTAFKKGL